MNLNNKKENITFLNAIYESNIKAIENTIEKIIDLDKFSIEFSIFKLEKEFLSFLYKIESKENININNDLSNKNNLYYLNKKEFKKIKKESKELSIQYLESSLISENKEIIIYNLSKKLINTLFDNKEKNLKIIDYNNYSFKNNYKIINDINNNLKIKDFLNSENLFNRFLELENIKENKINFISLKIRLLEKEIKNNKNTIFLEKELKNLRKRIKNISNINIKRNCIKILDKYYTNEKIRIKLVEIVKDFYYLIDLNNKSNDLEFNFKSIEKEINSFNIISYTESKRNNNIIKTKKEIFQHSNKLIKQLEKKDFYNFYCYLKNNKEIIKIESLNKNKSLKDLFLSNDFIFKVNELIFNSSKWYFNNHLEYVIKYNTFDKEYYVFDKEYRFKKVLDNIRPYNKNLIHKKEKELLSYKKESHKVTKYNKKGYSDYYKYLLNLSESELKDKYNFYLSKEYNNNKNQFLIDLRLNQLEKILYEKKLEINEIEKDKKIRNELEIEYNEKVNKELSKFNGYTINKNSYINYEFLEYGYNTNGELVLYNEPNENDLGDRDYY